MGAVTQGRKQQGHEADHSPPSSAEIKNAWSCISTPPIRLHGVALIKYREKFFTNNNNNNNNNNNSGDSSSSSSSQCAFVLCCVGRVKLYQKGGMHFSDALTLKLLSKNIKTEICKTHISCCFEWMLKLVCHIMVRTD